jgi:hypothetical protein
MAVYYDHHSIVGMLLAAEADANSKDDVSAALPAPSSPLPTSTVGPLTLGRQAQRKQQLNSRPVWCGVCGAVVGHPFAVHET